MSHSDTRAKLGIANFSQSANLLCEKTTIFAPKAMHNRVLFAVTHIYSVYLDCPGARHKGTSSSMVSVAGWILERQILPISS